MSSITAPDFRPIATPVTTVATGPAFTPGPAPSRAPSRLAPVQANLPTRPMLPDVQSFVDSMTGFSASLRGFSGVIQQERSLELQQSRADFQSQFMQLADDPTKQDALVAATRKNGTSIQVAAADEIYGALLGKRRSAEAQQMVNSGTTDFDGALKYVTDSANQDQSVYGSPHFKNTYTKALESTVSTLKAASDASVASSARKHLQDALFAGWQNTLDEVAHTPGYDAQAVQDKLNTIEQQYGPKGDKGKLTYEELNKNRMDLAEAQASQGRPDLTKLILSAARGDQPSLMDTPEFAQKSEELVHRATTRQTELGKSATQQSIANLDQSADHGRLSQTLAQYGFTGKTVEEQATKAVGAGLITAEQSQGMLHANLAGATASFQRSNTDAYGVVMAAVSMGTATKDITDPRTGKSYGPLSMTNPFVVKLIGEKEMPAVIARNAEAEASQQRQLTRKTLEDTAKDTAKTRAVTDATSVVTREPTDWHNIQDVKTRDQFGNDINVPKSVVKEGVIANKFTEIAAANQKGGPEAIRSAQAAWLVSGNIPALAFQTSIQTGLNSVPPIAYTDPSKVPQNSVEAYKNYQALVNSGGTALAHQLAQNETTSGKYEAVRFLADNYGGTDDEGIRRAIGQVADVSSRTVDMEGEKSRLSLESVQKYKTQVDNAVSIIQSRDGGKVSNPEVVAQAVKRMAVNIQAFTGTPGEAAWTAAAKQVGNSFRNVDGVAIPATTVGNVDAKAISAISQYVTKQFAAEYNAEHPSDKISADDISLRPNPSGTGVWGISRRDGAMWMQGIAAPKQWATGQDSSFDGTRGTFTTDQLLQLSKAMAQTAFAKLKTGTHEHVSNAEIYFNAHPDEAPAQ